MALEARLFYVSLVVLVLEKRLKNAGDNTWCAVKGDSKKVRESESDYAIR